MLAMWVKVRVKAEERERFLKAIEADAIGSERDEPDCLRFNVLRDQQDQNVYYFFEVYRNEAALEAHRAAPHYAVWRAAADTLDGPPEATRCDTVFPRRSSPGRNADRPGEASRKALMGPRRTDGMNGNMGVRGSGRCQLCGAG